MRFVTCKEEVSTVSTVSTPPKHQPGPTSQTYGHEYRRPEDESWLSSNTFFDQVLQSDTSNVKTVKPLPYSMFPWDSQLQWGHRLASLLSPSGQPLVSLGVSKAEPIPLEAPKSGA